MTTRLLLDVFFLPEVNRICVLFVNHKVVLIF